MTRSLTRRLAVGVGVAVATVGMAGLTTAAYAADPTEPEPLLTAQYDAKGTSHITKGNFDVPLGPTKLVADVSSNPDNPDQLDFLATMPLPPKTVKLKAFGYLPVQAKVYFSQVGPVTGYLGVGEGGTTTAFAEAKYVVTLRDVVVGGAKANVGDNCQTRYPIVVDVYGQEGFNLGGGDLAGTYDLGKFNNCRTSTELTNLIVPSNNNSIKLSLTNLQLVDSESSALAKKASKKFAAAAK